MNSDENGAVRRRLGARSSRKGKPSAAHPPFPGVVPRPYTGLGVIRVATGGATLGLALVATLGGACSSSNSTVAGDSGAATSGAVSGGSTPSGPNAGSGSGGASGATGGVTGTPTSSGPAGSSAGATSGSSGASGAPDASGSSGASTAAGTSGSSSGAGAGDAGDASANSHFVLSWQDNFDTLDTSRWQLESFTYAGNQAQFVPQNATVQSGILTIALTTAAGGAPKPYNGVEMRSTKTITYGKVSSRMRFAKGSGVVSGLVLFYTPFPNCDWNEIDIEHLGDLSNSSQLNSMVYVGSPMPNCATSVTPTQDPLVVDLGFNAESDFHQYDVEWTPAGVQFYGDGKLLRNWTKNIALLNRPQNILLTIWASASASWAGPLTTTSAPTSAQIDWIQVYDWKG